MSAESERNAPDRSVNRTTHGAGHGIDAAQLIRNSTNPVASDSVGSASRLTSENPLDDALVVHDSPLEIGQEHELLVLVCDVH